MTFLVIVTLFFCNCATRWFTFGNLFFSLDFKYHNKKYDENILYF